LRILDLASAKDRRVSIAGDVELDIASRKTDDDVNSRLSTITSVG